MYSLMYSVFFEFSWRPHYGGIATIISIGDQLNLHSLRPPERTEAQCNRASVFPVTTLRALVPVTALHPEATQRAPATNYPINVQKDTYHSTDFKRALMSGEGDEDHICMSHCHSLDLSAHPLQFNLFSQFSPLLLLCEVLNSPLSHLVKCVFHFRYG